MLVLVQSYLMIIVMKVIILTRGNEVEVWLRNS